MVNSTCINIPPTTSHGIWQGDDPLHFSLPLLIVQMVLVLAVTRALGLLLRPLRQPRVIAEIIGGILLGPSALGRNSDYMTSVFNKHSVSILTTLANLGLMFFLFMVGLELDLSSLKKTGKQAAMISIAGISLPFAAGIGVSIVLHTTINPEAKFLPFLVFMGVAMSITAFPVLARILADRRLLSTDVGKMAISAAAANDVVAWIFLALAVALSGSGRSPIAALWIFLSGVGFVIAMFLLIKPVMSWIASRSPADQPVKELYVCIAFGGVLVAGLVTDFIGIHGIFGAFVFGLIIPEGNFADALIEKLEDFVTVLLLPLYFAASGLQTNIGSISGVRSFGLLMLVIAAACGGKILGTLAVSMAYGEKFRKALALGFLMNTKGLVELIVLNIGKERKVLNEETFAIMVLMALFTTFITTPVVMALYKPARDQIPYKRRKLTSELGSELRLLVCVHGMKNVPAMMNLVESTRGSSSSKKDLLRLYVLHLVELSERSSAIKLVQRMRLGSASTVDGIPVAFGASAELKKVGVRSMTAISSFHDMHEDVCGIASSKRAALIILPFHRYDRTDGVLESMNPGFRDVNRRVLAHAPCSVGILVDRGASQPLHESSPDERVAVLFFGGPDDREALELGLRMVEHPGIKLSVIRFISSSEHQEHAITVDESHLQQPRNDAESGAENMYQVAAVSCSDELQLDEEAITKVKHLVAEQSGGSEGCSIAMEELHITGDDLQLENEVLSVARRNEHGLIIVGRGRKPVAGVAVLSRRAPTYGELGPVGDALAAANSELHHHHHHHHRHPQLIRASVLVIQQYDAKLVPDEVQSSSTS